MHLFMCLLLSLLVTELCHFHRGKKTFFIRSGKVMSVIKAVKSTWKKKCIKLPDTPNESTNTSNNSTDTPKKSTDTPNKSTDTPNKSTDTQELLKV